MLNQFSSIELLTSNIFNMQNLRDLLSKLDNVLSIPYDFLTDDFTDIACSCIPAIEMKLRIIKDDDVSKIMSKLESTNEINLMLLKCIQTVINNNEEMFIISEVISHGITYCDATEKVKTIVANLKQLIDGSMVCKFNGSSKILQIGLSNDNLDSLILKILKNINNKFVLIPSINGTGVLSAFLLVYLMHQESADIKNKITFILPEKNYFIGDEIVCTKSWIRENRNFLSLEKVYNIEFDEKKSCFLIFSNSNLFSAVVNYVNLLGGTSSNTRKIPQVCLIQENVYVKFINLLKSQLLKTNELKLLDRNRQIAVNSCTDSEKLDLLLKSIKENDSLSVLLPVESCSDYGYFFPTIVIDNCQPQQPLFYDEFANRFCSFILTFRTVAEGITLANQLYRDNDSVYLWTESISQCFSLKKLLNYDDIFVNIAQNYAMLTGETNYKFSCKGSFFVPKEDPVDGGFISVNDITAKLIPMKSGSGWRSESFYHRYSRVVEMINKLVAAELLSKDGGKFLLEYLENRVKPFQFHYIIRDSLNKLTESFPIGNVILDLGMCIVDDKTIQTILLLWLFGNDLLVVSTNEIPDVERCFIDGSKKATLVFMKGRLRLKVVAQCSFVDSVICFDDSVSSQGFIDEDFTMRLLYQSLNSTSSNTELFNEIVSFARKEKSLYILSGDVGIS